MMVAICDDDQIFRENLRNILIEYKRKLRICIDIYEFPNGEELIKSKLQFNIVFLDYQMPGIDGMKVARKLRARKNFCSIIFVTSFPQFVLESFEVQPYRFFVKPIDYEKIYKAIDSYISQQKLLSPITIIIDNELRTLKSEDVVYLEADGKYCYIRTAEETLHSSKTLSQIQALLPYHCFYRVHKTYLINMYCVDTIQNNIVIMNNGEKAIVGKSKIAEFKKDYKDFVRNYYIKV